MPNPMLNYTPQDAPNFSPNRPGAQQGGQDMSFLEDPAFQTEFQKVLDSTPGLSDAMQQDPDLASHIMGSLAARKPLPLGEQTQAPQAPPANNPFGGFDVGTAGGARPGMAPPQVASAPGAEPPVPQKSDDFASMYGATPGPAKSGAGGFGEYVNSQAGRDDMMMGLIMSNYAQNPEKALQLAMQFKQGKDQRKYQAEQNDLQREATRENLKIRKELEQKDKEDKVWQNDRSKGIAVLQQNGLTADDLTARLGVWDKDNNEDMVRGVTALVAEKKKKDKDEKEEQQDFKNKENIARSVHINGKIVSNQYTREFDRDGKKNPKYDPQYVSDIKEIAEASQEREKLSRSLKDAELEAIRAEGKLKASNRTAAQKLEDKVKFTQLASIQKQIDFAQTQLNTYEPYKEGKNAYGDTYWANAEKMNEILKEYNKVLTSIGVDVELADITPKGEEDTGAAPYGTGRPAPDAEAAPTSAAPAAPAATTPQAANGEPPPEAYDNYRIMKRNAKTPEEKAEVSRQWGVYFKGFAEPTGE